MDATHAVVLWHDSPQLRSVLQVPVGKREFVSITAISRPAHPAVWGVRTAAAG